MKHFIYFLKLKIELYKLLKQNLDIKIAIDAAIDFGLTLQAMTLYQV